MTVDIDKFLQDGWVVCGIPNATVVLDIIARLQEVTGCKLSEIHKNYSDKDTKGLHVVLSEYFWKQRYSFALAEALKPLLKEIVGLDLMVQFHPYVRVARPNKPQDNIGYHKDTQYGQTPYELAIHIPFVDLDERSALRVISGSQRMKECVFPLIACEEKKVEKGSIENHTGRPYAPKRLAIPDGMQAVPMRVGVGQCAIFSPALFHGQEVNNGNATRVSCDLRVVNSYSPVKVRIGTMHAGYVPVARSPIDIMAKEYYAKQ